MDGFEAYRARIKEARQARHAEASVRRGEGRRFDGGSVLVTVLHPDGSREEGVRVTGHVLDGGAQDRVFVGEDGRKFKAHRRGAKTVQGVVEPL